MKRPRIERWPVALFLFVVAAWTTASRVAWKSYRRVHECFRPRTFKNAPKHVALALDPSRDADSTELAKRAADLVHFCFSRGARTVSLYDAAGALKRNADALADLLDLGAPIVDVQKVCSCSCCCCLCNRRCDARLLDFVSCGSSTGRTLTSHNRATRRPYEIDALIVVGKRAVVERDVRTDRVLEDDDLSFDSRDEPLPSPRTPTKIEFFGKPFRKRNRRTVRVLSAENGRSELARFSGDRADDVRLPSSRDCGDVDLYVYETPTIGDFPPLSLWACELRKVDSLTDDDFLPTWHALYAFSHASRRFGK